MLEHVHAWLGKVLKNVRAGHGKLTIVRVTRNARSMSSRPRARPASERSPLCRSLHSQMSLSSLKTVPTT